MLLHTESVKLYHQLKRRWDDIDSWLTDPANSEASAKVWTPIDVFRKHWSKVDRGLLLTDSDELLGACQDMDTAENYAMDHGFVASGHGTCPGALALANPALVNMGQAAEEYCKENPKDLICTSSDPKDGRSWCQRVGFPDSTCDEHGLKDWFKWALGAAGLTFVGGIAYAAYKGASAVAPYAVPLALSAYAPGALPAYQEVQRRKASQVPDHVLKAMAET